MRKMLLFSLLLPLLDTPLSAQGQAAGNQPVPKVLILQFTRDYAPSGSTEDTVYYDPSRPLTWDDFTGKEPAHSDNIAVTYSSFAYVGSAEQTHDTLIVKLTLQVFFIKSDSWVSQQAYNNHYALTHEQMHFDLTRIAADGFRQRILKGNIPPEDADSYIQYQYIEAFRDMNHLQDQYDTATHHGQDHAAEQQWEQYVHKRLAAIYGNDSR